MKFVIQRKSALIKVVNRISIFEKRLDFLSEPINLKKLLSWQLPSKNTLKVIAYRATQNQIELQKIALIRSALPHWVRGTNFAE